MAHTHSPTPRPWKASPQCTNPYFHSKNVALSIRAKHSQVILTLADICQLVNQGIDQILIIEAGDSRVRDGGCKNGTSIGTEENWGLPGDLWVIYVDIVYLILYVLHVTCNQFAIFAQMAISSDMDSDSGGSTLQYLSDEVTKNYRNKKHAIKMHRIHFQKNQKLSDSQKQNLQEVTNLKKSQRKTHKIPCCFATIYIFNILMNTSCNSGRGGTGELLGAAQKSNERE